jgi:tetratricopeptide (TPR) repeat protein
VIAGRLAQLSEHARETAAAAAVIGRAFDLHVLVRLVGDEDVVVRALDELWRMRIVREQGPNAYDFTHDKLRDVAYGETSAPQRRLLHRRVADALVAAHEQDLGPVSAQVAAHYESAGLFEQAIPHYSRAAVVAQGVYAHDEAIALVGRGLTLLRQLPASARRDGWELELQLVLVPSYRVTMGLGSWALLLDRALALCDRVGTRAQRAQILYGMQQRYAIEGRLEKSALIMDEMVRHFRETQASKPPRLAFAMMAGVRLQMGRFQEACDDLDGLVREADPGQLHHLQESQGPSYEVIARAWQSHALWCLGRPDDAFERASQALRLARQLGQPFSQAIAATHLVLSNAGHSATSSAGGGGARATEFRRRQATGVGCDPRRHGDADWRAGARVFAPSRASRRRGHGSACPTSWRCWRTPGFGPVKPTPASTSWKGACPTAGRRTSAGGTRSFIACARS